MKHLFDLFITVPWKDLAGCISVIDGLYKGGKWLAEKLREDDDRPPGSGMSPYSLKKPKRSKKKKRDRPGGI